MRREVKGGRGDDLVKGDPRRGPVRRVVDPAADFLRAEAAGGVVLLVATVAALAWANTAGEGYASLWHEKLDLSFAGLDLDLDLRHWVNDALMAVFFFVVGLEIKRELVVGELNDRRAAALPVMAALGGVALPALIFFALTAGTPFASGWAIPAATDIAFAVGVLALLGDRVSAGLKLFLVTVAIVDDVSAILIIALFYSSGLSGIALLAAAGGLGIVLLLRRLGVTAIAPYVVVGAAVWLAVHESGVHATIAGVALALLTPTGEVGGRDVLEGLEERLHPLTAFLIVPLFALANTGIDLGGGVVTDALSSRLAWAVVIALVIGKLIGIAAATFLGLKLNWGSLPEEMQRAQVWGLAALGGIGFTVSLFIANLAYDDAAVIDTAKVGIFTGSLLSGVLGAGLLMRAARRAPPPGGSCRRSPRRRA